MAFSGLGDVVVVMIVKFFLEDLIGPRKEGSSRLGYKSIINISQLSANPATLVFTWARYLI